jgi:hypothetical protein
MNKAETALLEMIERMPGSVCLETGAYAGKEASDIIVFYHTAQEVIPELIAERDKYRNALDAIDLRLQGRQNYWIDEIKEIVTQAQKDA